MCDCVVLWFDRHFEWIVGSAAGVLVVFVSGLWALARFLWARFSALSRVNAELRTKLQAAEVRQLAENILAGDITAAASAVHDCEKFITYADALAKTMAESKVTYYGGQDYAVLLLHNTGDVAATLAAQSAPEELIVNLRAAQRLVRDGLAYVVDEQTRVPSMSNPRADFQVAPVQVQVGRAAESARAWLADLRRQAAAL